MGREQADVRAALLKFGVALALSLGGILFSIFRTQRSTKPSKSLPPPPVSDSGNQIDAGGEEEAIENDHHAVHTESLSLNSVSFPPAQHEELHLYRVSSDNSTASLSPSSRCSGDKDGFLLPEFNDLMKEFDLASSKSSFSPKKNDESTHSDEEAPKAYNYAERGDYEQEIKHLKEMVRVLRQRERNLEDQLLEYYGLKEQETAVMELQNRLKVHNMEAKLFNLKIESLQAENRRLEAQLADYAKVVSELEAARTTIKLLKKKLKSETVQNKEQILSLKERVKNMQDQEHETLPSHAEVQLKLQQLEELQEAVNELRKSNYNLQLENSNLAQKLESTQMLANSVLEDQEAEALKVESYQLRQQNEDLLKEIENLKSDRCADLEELVYLRWINACLRYELRNYQPGPGKTVARDLGKSLSPKSEEKAKQLIIEYAFKEGFADKGINITDSDIELLSSSLSYLTDSGEFDDTSIDNSTSNRTDTTNKTKIFGKLRRLVRGKECHRHRRSQSLEITASVGDSVGQSGDSLGRHLVNSSGEHNKMRSSSGDLERLRSLKVDRQDLGGSLRNNDSGSACIYKCLALGRKNLGDLLQENSLNESPGSVQKPELVKYAKALKGSSGESSKFHRRSASHVSFL